jgi:hypothetical protein
MRDMHTALQAKEHRLMGTPEATGDLIPQLVWAIISATRDFYGHISTRADVDPNHDSPSFAIAQLSIYTTMLKAGLRMDLAGVPDQWKRKAPVGTTPAATHNGTEQGGTNGKRKKDSDTNTKRFGSDPFTQQTGQRSTTVRTNPKVPRVFADCEPLRRAQASGRIRMSELASEAGIQGGLQGLNVPGLPTNACLTYICLGSCAWPKCPRDHINVDDAAVTALFKQLEPGITRLADKKKPKTNA